MPTRIVNSVKTTQSNEAARYLYFKWQVKKRKPLIYLFKRKKMCKVISKHAHSESDINTRQKFTFDVKAKGRYDSKDRQQLQHSALLLCGSML